jgi:NAD(P)-dependent dehydrogenase (short-subunit alcohol dehydrogenase family)
MLAGMTMAENAGHPTDYPRAALVTGAARRIGRAIAANLAAHGWAVAVHYNRSQSDADLLVQEISEAGGRAVALAADLSREDQAAGLVGRTVEALGPLGCLVNSASTFERDEAATATRESWDAHMEPNLRAPLVLIQNFADALPDGKGGAVINLLDERVWNLTPHFLSYTVSKAALWTLTQTLALALAPRIRVNGIGPGPTLPSARQTPEQFARQCASLPLGGGTTPEEICRAVQFLLAAKSVTGQMIALDGGQHLGWAQASRRDNPEE